MEIGMTEIEPPDHINVIDETDDGIVVSNERTGERYPVSDELAEDAWGA